MTALSVFIKSHIWIGLCAASSYLYASVILSTIDFNFNFFLLIFFSTTALYNFLGLLKKKKRLNSLTFVITAVLAISTGIYLELYNYPKQLLPAVILGFLYGYAPGIKKGIRSLPFIKIFLISSVWIYVTSIIPLLIPTVQFDSIPYLFLISQFFFLIAVTIPFDVRDLPFDEKRMKTIPQLLGEKHSVDLSLILLALSTIFISLHCYAAENYTLLIPVILVQLLSAIVILKTRVTRPKFFFTGLVDGLLFLQGMLLWIFSAAFC